ncbi:hypothetical protein [Thiocapsa bogorovii]|uniref:hypothetical protein n=1 Tax=Thiocapsa bogorovii TaxID=521689 RepID=UPI001E55596E|nr:hypothetical protein [Thiocapsa bogorovii]UHD17163.1 hypothetical protein LT988_03660 [Thiocapsa bogorovii]
MSRIQGSESERRLVRSFRALAAAERDTLLAFAEFLAQRGAATPEPHRGPREPVPAPRPSTESVVAAIKRLSKTYAMLDRGPMLNETSALMSAHVLQGRSASEVIDDLEALFARHYRDYRAKFPSEG